MNKPKETGWYPGNVKPVRVGEYRVDCDWGCVTHYWTGAEWWLTKGSCEALGSYYKWRGLTEPSK
jgi:hypothetical protein